MAVVSTLKTSRALGCAKSTINNLEFIYSSYRIHVLFPCFYLHPFRLQIATDRVKDIQIKNTPSDEPLPEVELIDDIVKDKLKEIDLAKQITEKVEAKLGKEEDSEEEEEIGRKNKKKSVVIMSDEGSGEEVAIVPLDCITSFI